MDEAAPRLARSLLPPNSALRNSGYKKEGAKEKAASQQAPREVAKKNNQGPVCRNSLRTDPDDCAGIRTGNKTRERPPPSCPPHPRASAEPAQLPKTCSCTPAPEQSGTEQLQGFRLPLQLAGKEEKILKLTLRTSSLSCFCRRSPGARGKFCGTSCTSLRGLRARCRPGSGRAARGALLRQRCLSLKEFFLWYQELDAFSHS